MTTAEADIIYYLTLIANGTNTATNWQNVINAWYRRPVED